MKLKHLKLKLKQLKDISDKGRAPGLSQRGRAV
jgi:hypothetical protein